MNRVARMAVGAGLALVAVQGITAPPPVSAFLDFASFQQAKISPDGHKLAFTQRDDAGEYLTVVGFPDLKPMMHTGFGKSVDVDQLLWAGDDRLLIQPARRIGRSMDRDGPSTEIFGIDVDGRNAKVLFGGSGNGGGIVSDGGEARLARRYAMAAAGEVIDPMPDETGSVLIQTRGFFGTDRHDGAYRMNIRTGKLERVAASPLANGSFLTDASHNVALVRGEDDNGTVRVYFRSGRKDDWQLKITYDMLKGGLQPLALAREPGLYLARDGSDGTTSRIVSWNPVSGDKATLFERPESSVSLSGLDPYTGRAWMFTYTGSRAGYWYPDPQHPLAILHQALRQAFTDAQIDITSHSRDGSLAVAKVSSPTLPPRYLVLDTGSRRILFQQQTLPQLKSTDLSPMQPIEFHARDGRTIRGYLTTPNGADRKGLPTIVLVHDGPVGGADVYAFNPVVALLASRGYAVLQINYRGSGGRGSEFQSAGYGQWGGSMQDDITDGVKWALAEGVADPKRVCILGKGYGAYAALTGAFREPDMFRCAVGLSGFYDLTAIDVASTRSGVNHTDEVVNPHGEEAKRRSPLYHADQIKAAVMLVPDPVESLTDDQPTVRMKAALEKAGNPAAGPPDAGTGDDPFSQKYVIGTYEKILEFFAKQLGS